MEEENRENEMELQNKTVMIEGIGQNQRLLRMEEMKVQIDLILDSSEKAFPPLVAVAGKKDEVPVPWTEANPGSGATSQEVSTTE